MDLGVVDPALRKAARRVDGISFGNRVVRALVRLAGRLGPVPTIDGVRVETVREGDLRLRVYRPTTVRTDALLLWVHGGGYVIGAAKQDERTCGDTAAALGMTVVSADYRLAPEHPFPAALDGDRVVVGGESAGGGLAAALVQRLRDVSPVQPIGQWLFAPMLDDRTATRHELDEIDHWVWDHRANRFGWSSYLGSAPGAETLPEYAVPARRNDLAGLPSTWIGDGDIELFAAEDAEYARRLRAAGVAVVTDVVTGAPHGFSSWGSTTAPARAFLGRARGWLAEVVRPTAAEPPAG